MIARNRTAYFISTKYFLLIMLCVLAFLETTAFGAKAKHKSEFSATTLRAMARIYMSYGQYDKAEPLALRALAAAEKNNLADDEKCLCLSDLAYIYANTGKFDKAEEKCRQGLKLQQDIYGENHPYSAYILRTLASVYLQQARYDQAQTALEQAMNIMQKTICLAADRAIAPFQIDLANLFIEQGKYDEAESYFVQALPAISEAFGPEHLYTANVLGNMAKLYVFQGKYSQAEMLITQAVTIQEKVYGSANSLIAPSWLTMANICWTKGDFAQAEKLIQKALSAIEKTGNVTEMVMMQQRIMEIRSVKPAAFGLVAKAAN